MGGGRRLLVAFMALQLYDYSDFPCDSNAFLFSTSTTQSFFFFDILVLAAFLKAVIGQLEHLYYNE